MAVLRRGIVCSNYSFLEDHLLHYSMESIDFRKWVSFVNVVKTISASSDDILVLTIVSHACNESVILFLNSVAHEIPAKLTFLLDWKPHTVVSSKIGSVPKT